MKINMDGNKCLRDGTEHRIILGEYTFIFRAAVDDDYDFVFNLLKENMLESFNKNWGFWNELSFEKTHRKENIRIIAHENTRIGYIDFKFKHDCGYINDIQLSEKFRNKGLGTYIMQLVEQETLNHGLKRICLKVFKDNAAVKLYKRLGYNPIFEDDTSLIMEKNIVL